MSDYKVINYDIFRYMLCYLARRVSLCLHETIDLSFMVVGPTEFGPDRCLGLIKQAYRRHGVSSLEQLSDVIGRRYINTIQELIVLLCS